MEKKKTTIILFNGDYDKAMAAYIHNALTLTQLIEMAQGQDIKLGYDFSYSNKNMG